MLTLNLENCQGKGGEKLESLFDIIGDQPSSSTGLSISISDSKLPNTLDDTFWKNFKKKFRRQIRKLSLIGCSIRQIDKSFFSRPEFKLVGFLIFRGCWLKLRFFYKKTFLLNI